VEFCRTDHGTQMACRLKSGDIERSWHSPWCDCLDKCTQDVRLHLYRGVDTREGMSVLSTRLVFDLGVGATTGYESIDLEYGQPQDTVCILSDIEPTEDHDSLFTTMAVCCIKSWVLRMFKTGPPHQYEYLSTREHTSY